MGESINVEKKGEHFRSYTKKNLIYIFKSMFEGPTGGGNKTPKVRKGKYFKRIVYKSRALFQPGMSQRTSIIFG